jgi:hypothetical protein
MKAKAPRKPARAVKTRKRQADDPAQYERFREFAREHEADDDPEAFDRAFRAVVKPTSVAGRSDSKRRS